MSDTNLIRFIDTTLGQVLLKSAIRKLKAAGLPSSEDDGNTSDHDISIETFTASVGEIMVPAADGNKPASDGYKEAHGNFDAMVSIFMGSIEPPPTQREARTVPAAGAGRMSLSMEGAAQASAQLSFVGSTAASGAEPSDGDMEEVTDDVPAAAGAKRQRLGMTDSDLARACTVMDLPVARPATPQFLVDKPLDVRLYTPLLIDLYSSVRKVNERISQLAAEVLQFEGDFLELSAPAVAALPTTPLVASMNTAAGSRFFHKLDLLRETAATLKAKNLRTQRAFWLANHTPGCNWDTWDQLVYREEQDAGAGICNPGFTPLTTWEDQVKAAIVGARQESAGLSKDGKSLLGPVLPRLLARHGQPKAGQDRRSGTWRGGGSTSGHKGAGASGGGGGKPPGAGQASRRGQKPPTRPTGKENRGPPSGAGAPAPSKSAVAAAGT